MKKLKEFAINHKIVAVGIAFFIAISIASASIGIFSPETIEKWEEEDKQAQQAHDNKVAKEKQAKAKQDAKDKAYKQSDESKTKALKDDIKNPTNAKVKEVNFYPNSKHAFIIIEGVEGWDKASSKRELIRSNESVVNDIKDSDVNVDSVNIQGNVNGVEMTQEEYQIK